MKTALSAFALVVAALAGAGLIAGSGAAHACTLDRTPSPAGLVSDQVAAADLIVVGVVTEETVVGEHGGNPSTPTYASTVDVRAVLAGSFDEPTLRLTPLGWLSASCTGGPRLLEGERVLLFLETANPFYQQEGIEFSEWQGVLQGAKYFFLDDEAFLEEQFSFEGGRKLAAAGDIVALIAAVAAAAQSDGEEIARAVLAALGEDDDEGRNVLLPVLGTILGVTVVAAGVLLFGWRRARIRAARPASGP